MIFVSRSKCCLPATSQRHSLTPSNTHLHSVAKCDTLVLLTINRRFALATRHRIVHKCICKCCADSYTRAKQTTTKKFSFHTLLDIETFKPRKETGNSSVPKQVCFPPPPISFIKLVAPTFRGHAYSYRCGKGPGTTVFFFFLTEASRNFFPPLILN